jgi:cytochrome c peroxidase
MRSQRSRVTRPLIVTVCVLAVALAGLAKKNPPPPPPPPAQAAIHPVLIPELAEGAGIIRPGGTQYAIMLGKALFWDQQAGSDGVACAGCHFHAGADTRLTNQINPGFNDLTAGVTPGGEISTGGDTKFGSTAGSKTLGTFAGGGAGRPNHTLKPKDFPGHQLADPTNRNSAIVITTNDRVSSQGAFDGVFDFVRANGKKDHCSDFDGSIFYAGKWPGMYPSRQVEPRNTPTVVNSGLNNRQFWDGRANNMFNGVGVFGMRDIYGDASKRLVLFNGSGAPYPTYLTMANASLASQALGPPTNAVEMSCDGRIFADVAKKLLATTPLAKQKVDSTDSVLGAIDVAKGKGLDPTYTYDWLIRQAFEPKWWQAPGLWRIIAPPPGQINPPKVPATVPQPTIVSDPTGYTQEQLNFSMFWGISIMMYEQTLISNQSEYDNLVAPGGGLLVGGALSPIPGLPVGCAQGPGPTVDPLLLRGCQIFHGVPFIPAGPLHGAGCIFCHTDPTFSENQLAGVPGAPPFTPFLSPVTDIGTDTRGPLNDLRDLGFANIGIRPVLTDMMLGRVDPYGIPLSFGRQYLNYLSNGNDPSFLVDPFLANAVAALPGNPGALAQGTPISLGSGIPVPGPPGTLQTFLKLEVDGADKVPHLRNVGLTPPYFSWGYYANLRQVMEVYNRGLSSRSVNNTNAGVLNFDKHSTACIFGDDSGTGPLGNDDPQNMVSGSEQNCDTNITGAIVPLFLSACDAPVGTTPYNKCIANGQTTANDDLAAMVRFMLSLTDPRVQCSAAPFDHPALVVTTGHTATDSNGDGKADDTTYKLPAVGAAGYKHGSGNCIPNAGDLFAPGMQTTSGGPGVAIP